MIFRKAMTDSTHLKVVRWNALHILLTIAATQGELMLTSNKQYAQLQGDITLTCNTSDDLIEFRRDGIYVGRCTPFNCESTYTNKFIVIKIKDTSGNNLFALTIKDFKVNDAGKYTCVNSNKPEQIFGKQITYAVDIISVTLTPKANLISVIENTPQLFKCLTSICRPKANVTWYLGSEQLTSATVSSPSQDVTSSTLNFTSQRKHQNMTIHCQGSNGGQLRTSDKPTINVIYGPSQIVCKLGGSTLSSAVSVKEGWEFRLDCSSDGNPSPSFSWTHPGDGPSYPLFIRSINRTHAGRFTIIARNKLIPSEQKAFYLTKDIYVKVEVQYPPDPPSCRVGSSARSSNIVSAIQGHIITIRCSCDSNPPSRYSWSVIGVSTPTSGQSFILLVQKSTTITLTMENSMQFTNGKNEQGRSETPIEVNVLFPPVVKPLKIITVLEKSQVNVACEVTAGVPNKTIFRWENISDMTSVATEQTLGIANISRAQGGYYRCNATNFMEPTGYDSTVGNSYNTVYINVQYEAEVTNFTLSNVDHGQTFEINENTQVKFYCRAQGNPLSKMGLYKQSEGLKTAINTNELEYKISSSECEDDGIYQCSAQNIHNAQADIRSLTLFVRCAPRASALAPRQQNVSSKSGVPAELTLTLVAFPRPRVADFVWEKEGSRLDTWHIVSNDTDINILISEDGLQTKLSFSSIKQKDFGFYRVRVSNKLGQFIGTFRLQAPVRPHAPSNLQQFKKATVDTIYIVWTPAYDGGLLQTFHVEYREAGTSVWRKSDVIAGNINHTIVGLNQDTTYEIRVYATNVIGRSVSSEVITITTLKRPETNSDAGTVVGGAVGASIGAVLVVLVVLVILRRKFAVNCNVVRKIDVPAGQNVPDTDSPGCNAAQTYDEVSMTNNASHYDVLKQRENRPDNLDLYTPLDVSNSKPNVNERKEEPTYTNTVKTVL